MGAHAVVAQAAGVVGRRDEAAAQGVHPGQGCNPARVAEVIGVFAPGQGGAGGRLHRHDAGVFPALAACPAIKGAMRPPRLDPPPAQPTTTSGYSPSCSMASLDSSPMTDWCSSTWLSTEPSTYRLVAAAGHRGLPPPRRWRSPGSRWCWGSRPGSSGPPPWSGRERR